jgi:hypothetical protein
VWRFKEAIEHYAAGGADEDADRARQRIAGLDR